VIPGNPGDPIVPLDLCVTATGAVAAAVTLTLPAVALSRHYISFAIIEAYAGAAVVGGAVPVLVTTTNLAGAPVFTFATAKAIGTNELQIVKPGEPIRSTAVNTATTIVCPATAGFLWRVTVWYFVGT